MPNLLEICLEETNPPLADERYIRCVALPGGEPGLALDREGTVRWMPDEPTDFGLWVSADDQLILLRAEGAGPITVSRAGRSLAAPVAMPVVLLDQDLLQIDGRQLRVHVHGATDEVRPPERLSSSALARVARATATALALSAAVGVADGAAGRPALASPPPIEVRVRPPAVRRVPRVILCDVTSVTSARTGAVVRATCPPGPVPPVGSFGQLLDPKGADIQGGRIEVRQVKGRDIVGETPLRNVKAAKAKFMRD
jgi:hypothetical protein